MPQDNNRSHLVFTNESIKNNSFFKGRGRNSNANNSEEEEDEEQIPRNYSSLKARLVEDLVSFNTDLSSRIESRTLPIDIHIEYVEIKFFKPFQKDLEDVFRRFGLLPVNYRDLNQTILFYITNYDLFEGLINHIREFGGSSDDEDPHNKEYSIVLLISSFELLTSNSIISEDLGSTITLEVIDSVYTHKLYSDLYNRLEEYLLENNISYTVSPSIIDLSNVNRQQVEEIVNNFDIIAKVASHRTGVARPSDYGQAIRDYDFELIPNPNAPLVGVIDTGVSLISPLRAHVEIPGIDLTGSSMAYMDSEGHGTAVAGLVVLGEEFYRERKARYLAKAKIFPIKAIEFDNDPINVSDLCNAVIDAHVNYGVRIFNLSLVDGRSKAYNEAQSSYAYELDRLAYSHDLLIFISAGNLAPDDVHEMDANPDLLHNYPNHFFNPNKSTMQHCCASINLSSPAESYNNLTIGALADNLEDDARSHLSTDKGLPAFYSRKFHYNYADQLHGSAIRNNQINYNIFKPDLAFAGGDLLDSSAQMQVMTQRTGLYYERRSGTSLSAPLVASLAAQIVQRYPALNMQSVKALILNSCSDQINSRFLNDLCIELKEETAQALHRITFDDLPRGVKNKISSRYNSENLYKYLKGHGKPNTSVCLYSNSNAVTFVVESNISSNTHEVLELNLPGFMKTINGKFVVDATLCYKFPPQSNNQLGYCPVHISFGFFKEPSSIALIGTQDGPVKDLQFKSGVTWSDDYYPAPTKPFANTQKVRFLLQKKDLELLDSKVLIALRCVHKEVGIDPELIRLVSEQPNDFSLIVRITEAPKSSEVATGMLYDEIAAINSMDILNDTLSTLDADLDIE